MADITMCTSENCTVRDSCYRAQAEPSDIQSWSDFEYTCNENSGLCDYIKMNNQNGSGKL